jgi:low affinity Fe/Cu permease
VNEAFRRFSARASNMVGSSWAFLLATAIILAWAITGPLFGFSNTWQLIINTGTTVVTFLMVFLIQNTQNRDARAIHLKLDELIKGVKGARTNLVDLEDMTDDELDALQKEFTEMHERLCAEAAERGQERGAQAGARTGALVSERVARQTAEDRAEDVAEDTVREVVGR